jgi:hypothetical protein
MIGKVAKCRHGKIGIIMEVVSPLYGRKIYYGIRFDGKQWQSVDPTIIADSAEEYVKNNPEEFFPLMDPSKI